jgi:peptidylamidoglycolate lyase
MTTRVSNSMPRRQPVCQRAAIFWGMTALACSPQSLPSPKPAAEAPAGPLGYRVVHGWPRLPPGELLGQVSGVGLDSRGTVIVFRRAQRSWPLRDSLSTAPIEAPTVLLFDGASGRQLGAWGAGRFAMPHGLTVDGQDNIWVTDVALHQVFKFTRDGALLLTLGERGVPGDDGVHFNRPTDVAVARDGSFYVSDGYRNSRVVRFSKDGRYLFSWGRKGSRPGEFDVPHSIARDATGQVYVADRSNARIQVFDSVGHFLAEWKGPELGRPWAVRVGADGYLYVVDGGDQPTTPPDRARVLKLTRQGRVIELFGSFGNYDGQFVWPHAVAVATDGTLYVGDVSTGMRVQKFIH